MQSYNPGEQAPRFGLFRFRSPLLAESLRFLFLGLLRCFNSPGWLRMILWVRHSGLPHSEILGSQARCAYPKLIAA